MRKRHSQSPERRSQSSKRKPTAACRQTASSSCGGRAGARGVERRRARHCMLRVLRVRARGAAARGAGCARPRLGDARERVHVEQREVRDGRHERREHLVRIRVRVTLKHYECYNEPHYGS